jgi:Protein of unknown function (DUF4233)
VSEPAPAPPPIDPLKGLRGVFAAVLLLESIVVALALLVLPKFGGGAGPVATSVVGGLAVLMLLAAFVQRRPWGLAVALVLQVALIVVGFLTTLGLGIMGLVFALVWIALLLMRRDVAGRMARGELPAQRLRAEQERLAQADPDP